MATLYLRDLSDETVTELKTRAACNHSRQAYTRALLAREVAVPAPDDVLARIEAQVSARLSTQDVLDDIELGRRHH
ncbi:FitA-like ribbon-helix-helix domain-containing protein [Streptomyces uncialis]|uniref:FitA-like ribbon-helix-helix domain-containing protein n=1 Tax=Streptomyces uncialis TaxID=1048205 RepID=UPI003819098D